METNIEKTNDSLHASTKSTVTKTEERETPPNPITQDNGVEVNAFNDSRHGSPNSYQVVEQPLVNPFKDIPNDLVATIDPTRSPIDAQDETEEERLRAVLARSLNGNQDNVVFNVNTQ